VKSTKLGHGTKLGRTLCYCFTLRLLCTNQSSLHCPPPSCVAHASAILLHVHCATYDTPPGPPCCVPYTIQYWYWQYRAKAKLCPPPTVSPYPLAFTRYCLTSRLLFTNQSSLYSPPPTCIARAIAILLHVHCAIYASLSTPPHNAIRLTTLLTVISQGATVPPDPYSLD